MLFSFSFAYNLIYRFIIYLYIYRTIGNELQTFLLSLEKSQSNGGSYSVISDCRIVKNGFKLIFMKGKK